MINKPADPDVVHAVTLTFNLYVLNVVSAGKNVDDVELAGPLVVDDVIEADDIGNIGNCHDNPPADDPVVKTLYAEPVLVPSLMEVG